LVLKKRNAGSTALHVTDFLDFLLLGETINLGKLWVVQDEQQMAVHTTCGVYLQAVFIRLRFG